MPDPEQLREQIRTLQLQRRRLESKPESNNKLDKCLSRAYAGVAKTGPRMDILFLNFP